MVYLNADEISFPDPELMHSDSGLLAIGGDLSPERLLFAYQTGLFPWSNEDEEILWWCPDPRFVLFPEEVIVSKSMRKILDSGKFVFTQNHCFEEVMRQCKNVYRKDQDGTWISDELIKSFTILNKFGYAKSFEVWQDENLVGGFYGIQIGHIFCGESMFSKVSNASKAGFLNFVLNESGIDLIDCQIHSDHLQSLGANMISKHEYLKILKQNNES